MASQEQLRQRLLELEEEIAILRAERDSNEFLRRPVFYKGQQTKRFNDLNKELTTVKKELNDLNKTQPYQSNQGTTNTGNTNKPSQADLENQLIQVDTDIRKKEAEITNLEKNPRINAQAIIIAKGELQKLKNDKARIENQLKNIAVASAEDPRARGKNRVEAPAPPPVTTSNTTSGLPGQVLDTRKQETARQLIGIQKNEDWRFRLYLAPNSTYLYNDKSNELLKPLNGVGVIFPYTPTVQVSYTANYDQQNITHSNYKLYFYKDSAVENISITGEFTAQNTDEANYLLAVIHFFKSATKMFYGQDQSPVNGTPPPICYIDGFGTYQFNKHPVLINNFSYQLPSDVDYIRASSPPSLIPETNEYPEKSNERSVFGTNRLIGINQGGIERPPQFTRQDSGIPTYVPTKIQITLIVFPVISRRDISNNFSVKEYANGNLLLGRDNKNIGAGIW